MAVETHRRKPAHGAGNCLHERSEKPVEKAFYHQEIAFSIGIKKPMVLPSLAPLNVL